MGNSVYIENATALPVLPESELTQLVDWILASNEQPPWQISLVFVDDDFMSDLNARYFDKATPTDVLSFNLSDPDEPSGEVYISVETAKGNATYYNASLESELVRLVAHGLYHLIGYDDATDEQKKVMTALENRAIDYWKS
jgi:rRNA maturation RNase YbeY